MVRRWVSRKNALKREQRHFNTNFHGFLGRHLRELEKRKYKEKKPIIAVCGAGAALSGDNFAEIDRQFVVLGELNNSRLYEG